MKLVMDMDGVLANFEENVYLIAEELWPGKMPKGYKPQNWDYTDIFTKDDWNEVWIRIKQTPGFWLRQPPIPEGVDALRDYRASNKNTSIYFLTSRLPTGGESAQYQTQLWLLKHRLINLKEVDNVIAVSKPEEKEDYIKSIGAEFSIDDLASTVIRHNQIPGHTAYLLRMPYNEFCTDQPTVNSVKEFLDKIS